jgi:hypothetical protein
MVRRDATDDSNSREAGPAGARRFRSAGVSPAPAGAEAPGSRPHAEPGDRLRERGITSLRGGVSRVAGSKHAGRNIK